MTDIASDQIPEGGRPANFYFNGALMPEWGAAWGLAGVNRWLDPEKDWDNEVGHRDVYLIACRIDHEGVVESADPGLFVYAVQEVLGLLIERRAEVMEGIRSGSSSGSAEAIYEGVILAAFEMRRLACEQDLAFWVSGSESDRSRLMEAMDLARLPVSDPRHRLPPHLRRLAGDLESCRKRQISALRGLAGSGQVPKNWRSHLLWNPGDTS